MTTAIIESPTLAIEAIGIDEEFNPRKSRDEVRFAELVDSIGKHGILQPVLVEPSEGGTYRLLAGARRVAAAKEAGLTVVPVHIREADDEATTYAVLENLQREQLNPIDEAASFKRVLDDAKITQKELAAKLSVSPGFVSERLGLLRLPEAIQNWMATGELATAAARPLEKVAKASEALAVHVGYLVRGQETSKLDERLPRLIDEVIEGMTADAEGLPELGTIITVDWAIGVDDVDWSGHEELRSRVEALHEATRFEPVLTDEDVDAAGAFKCVLECVQRNTWGETHCAWVFGDEFVISRIELQVVAVEKAIANRAKEAAASNGAVATDEGAPEVTVDPVEAERQRRANERASRKEEQRAAQSRNEEIGRKLMTKLHAPKITTARMRLLAKLILSAHGDLVAAGLAICDERLVEKEVKTLKSGETRTTVAYLESYEATQALTERVDRAKKPEEVLGLLMQALVAGAHADPKARTNAQMIRWHVPRGWDANSASAEIGDLIDRDALAVLPSDEAAALKESKKA